MPNPPTASPKPRWFTSSYSAGQGTDCVEVAAMRGQALVRDSKDPEGPVLDFGVGAWDAFVRAVKGGAGGFSR